MKESAPYIPPILLSLNPELANEILSASEVRSIMRNTEILRAGQFVKVIPLVLGGLVKVFSTFEDKELLLYYIRPNESCIMSFSAHLKNEPSKVYAQTEEDSLVMLIPVSRIAEWTRRYPEFSNLFFQQYNLRYLELLETISQVLFSKMDSRLYAYLVEKVRLTKRNPIRLSHRQIASELGTAREVVTRLLKKLESEGKLKQLAGSIEVLEL